MSGWYRDRIYETVGARPGEIEDAIERGELTDVELTWAFEEIGRVSTPRGLRLLRAGLEHPSPLAREGAVYGLGYWLAGDRDAAAYAQLRATAVLDASPGVRSAAAEAIEDLDS